MKRPSFQFYPGDWTGNSNLRRCSHAEKGAWLDVMCLMHDQEEYGVLRWPLKDIAQAAGCTLAHLKALVVKGVLKGSDTAITEPFTYTPRSGRRNGEPVVLIPAQEGPVWYCSRMVKDEYVRTIRGESSRFGEGNDAASKTAPKQSPTRAPKPPFGDGSSSSSSSSTSLKDKHSSDASDLTPGFDKFWATWPSTSRKTAKAECGKRWKSRKLEAYADQIIAHVTALKGTRQWVDGYEPAPLTYLNQRRWEDGEAMDETGVDAYGVPL